jgi:hypothetical protein
MRLPPALARFAVEVFLREAQYGGPARIAISRENNDLVLTSCQPVPPEGEGNEDVFRKVIEDAVMAAMPSVRFRTGLEGGRELRFENAVESAAGEEIPAGAGAVTEIRRLAS